MPVTIEFSPDQKVLLYVVTDPWEVPDLTNAYVKGLEYRDSVNHTVHSITDLSGIKRIPKNWLGARFGPGFKHPRSGEIVLAGITPGLSILVDTILRVMRYDRLKLFQTMGEAWEYLNGIIATEDQTDSTQKSS